MFLPNLRKLAHLLTESVRTNLSSIRSNLFFYLKELTACFLVITIFVAATSKIRKIITSWIEGCSR